MSDQTDQPQPLRLSERQRQFLIRRQVLQPPRSEAERQEFMKRTGFKNSAIPPDVLLALEGLRLLADQGNRVAEWLFVRECKRMGLWYDRGFSVAGPPGKVS